MPRWQRPPDNELPTIGSIRKHGLKAVHIHCLAYPCGHVGYKTFDELRLPDGMIFIHIARYRRLVCSKCGKRHFQISADWRDCNASGAGKPQSGSDF